VPSASSCPAAAELVYGLIAFVIVFLILSKVAFPRLNVMLDERRHAIQGRLEEAEAKLPRGRAGQARLRGVDRDAKGEAARIVDEAKQEAEQVAPTSSAQAEDEAAAVRERAQADAAAERDRTLLELRGEVGAMSVELASKIVEKELDPTDAPGPGRRVHPEPVAQQLTQERTMMEDRTSSYAEAIVALATAEGALDVVESELLTVARAIDTNDDLRDRLVDLQLPVNQRLKFVESTALAAAHPATRARSRW
jgi:F-type H+-transporting ATPase subunit b